MGKANALRSTVYAGEHTPENTNQWIDQGVRSLLESPKVLSLSDSKKDRLDVEGKHF